MHLSLLILVSQAFSITFCRESCVILINLKGWSHNYVNNIDTPFLYSMIQEGVTTSKLYVDFLSNNLPNFFTGVTGRSIEKHGIVMESMSGPNGEKWDENSKDANFWNQDGENFPIWIMNEAAGKKRSSAVLYTAAGDVEFSNYSAKYRLGSPSDSVPDSSRLEQVEKHIKNDKDVNFVHVTLSDVYAIARVNPSAPELFEAVRNVDKLLRKLYDEITEDDENINFILTSDAGLQQVDINSIIYLSDLITSQMDVVLEGATALINCAQYDSCTKIEKSLLVISGLENGTTSARNPELRYYVISKNATGKFLNYSNNPRIPDIAITAIGSRCILNNRRSDHNICSGGINGYLNYLEPSLKSILIAYGPAFNKNVVLKKVAKQDIYILTCYALNIYLLCPKYETDILRVISGLKPKDTNTFTPSTKSPTFTTNHWKIAGIIFLVMLLFIISGIVTISILKRNKVAYFSKMNFEKNENERENYI